MPSIEIIDISRDMLSCEVYPGDPEAKLRTFKSISYGDGYNLNKLETGLHNGTHVDAPLHFFDDGDSIESLDLETFIGPCAVIETPPGILTGAMVEKLFPRVCDRVLLKGKGRTFLHSSAASEIAFRGCKLLGIDSPSIEKVDSDGSAHRFLLGEGVALLEGLDLTNAREGEYFLAAQPVYIGGAEAAMCRAVLIKGHIFWSGSR
jgi:arylformamidase